MPLLGTDIYSGNADSKVQAAIARKDFEFHIFKAVEGRTVKDVDYQRNCQWAADAGDVSGCYGFNWMNNPGADEAKFLLDTAQPKPGQLIAGDWEDWGPKDSNGVRIYMVGVTWRQRWQHALDWTRVVLDETKTRPLCYVNWNYIKNFRTVATVDEWEWWIDNPLWLAQWQTNGVQTLPGQFDWAAPKSGSTKEWHPTFHQYISGSTSASGLDEDWFVGDRAALSQYTIQGDDMSAADVAAILAAVADVKKDVATLTNKVEQKANIVDVKAATERIAGVEGKLADINSSIGLSAADINGRIDDLGSTVGETTAAKTVEAVQDSLNGFTMSVKFNNQ